MSNNIDRTIEYMADAVPEREIPDWESSLNWFVSECLKQNIVTSREALKLGPCLCASIHGEELCFSPFVIGVMHGAEKGQYCLNRGNVSEAGPAVTKQIEAIHDKAKMCAEEARAAVSKEEQMAAFTKCMSR